MDLSGVSGAYFGCGNCSIHMQLTKTVKLQATDEWSTPLVPGQTFIEVFVDETDATTAKPWPDISGYRLVTGIAGPAGNLISIEADTLAAPQEGNTPYMFQPGVDYPSTNADGTNIRYAAVTFRVLDPNFSLDDDGQDTTGTRQYIITPVLHSSGMVYSHFAIETLADEEQNYEIGDLIELTGVTGPLGGIEADEINGSAECRFCCIIGELPNRIRLPETAIRGCKRN